jgi:class 3 adenylate cyclase
LTVTRAPADAAQALRAAMHLHESLTAWLKALPSVARRLSARASGHYGPAVVSRLGPAEHQHITATGDTVNLTSRLLEVAKQERASLVISEDLYAAAGARKRSLSVQMRRTTCKSADTASRCAFAVGARNRPIAPAHQLVPQVTAPALRRCEGASIEAAGSSDGSQLGRAPCRSRP